MDMDGIGKARARPSSEGHAARALVTSVLAAWIGKDRIGTARTGKEWTGAEGKDRGMPLERGPCSRELHNETLRCMEGRGGEWRGADRTGKERSGLERNGKARA